MYNGGCAGVGVGGVGGGGQEKNHKKTIFITPTLPTQQIPDIKSIILLLIINDTITRADMTTINIIRQPTPPIPNPRHHQYPISNHVTTNSIVRSTIFLCMLCFKSVGEAGFEGIDCNGVCSDGSSKQEKKPHNHY